MKKYNIKSVYIQVRREGVTNYGDKYIYNNLDINDPIQFPCWIIFKNTTFKAKTAVGIFGQIFIKIGLLLF